jgi:hypothetical protein
MADEEHKEPRDDEPSAQQVPHDDENEPQAERPPVAAEFHMELRETLPGDRAVIGVEHEGEFMWLASEKYVHPKAVDEFTEQLQRIVREGWWVQNWPGAR